MAVPVSDCVYLPVNRQVPMLINGFLTDDINLELTLRKEIRKMIIRFSYLLFF